VNRAPTPTPVIPDYQGANVRGIVPALLAPGRWADSLPDWMPEVVRGSTQVVLLVLDGLGWDQLQDHAAVTPTLGAMEGRAITTVAPTTTATALSSIATGLTPGEHGLIGYRMLLGGEVINVLRWSVENHDRRRSNPPADIQPIPAFLGHSPPVVSPAELQSSAFTEAHLRGGRPVGWRAASSIAVEVGEQLRAGERFVYAYYGGIDKIAHERGFGPYYESELRTADRLVADLLDELPSGAALVITADHGQVDVGSNIVYPSDQLLSHVAMQSGEGRFRWFHARRGAVDALYEVASAEFHDTGWVVTREQTIDEQWFGAHVPPVVANRLGDVAVVAYEPVSYFDPADSGPFELVCRHGSLTSAEVNVPLLAAAV
jgi:predicted AlkP superfamily pyrophosphatase or phosphodiesterase